MTMVATTSTGEKLEVTPVVVTAIDGVPVTGNGRTMENVPVLEKRGFPVVPVLLGLAVAAGAAWYFFFRDRDSSEDDYGYGGDADSTTNYSDIGVAGNDMKDIDVISADLNGGMSAVSDSAANDSAVSDDEDTPVVLDAFSPRGATPAGLLDSDHISAAGAAAVGAAIEEVPGEDVVHIMIRCPETGEPVSTGLSMEKETFEFAEFTGETLSPCPACGQAHEWGKEDAFLQDKAEEQTA
jgi:hypothetical protein